MKIEACNRPKHLQYEFMSDVPLSSKMESIPMYNELLNRICTSVILGPQGSGKTSLLMSMLQDKFGLKQKYNKVWVILPNTSLSNIVNSSFSKLPEDQILDDFDEENLQTIFDDVKERAEENADLKKNKKKKRGP
ncbi:MAG: hypothetical protein EOP48_05520 [Sphingobacteriales bacterium]|nr:MAG: hypothetical protein EOP48_05520 [Sphingobacteriales bacterium]